MGIHHPLETLQKLGNVMSLRQLSTRIELSFWQIMINLLSGSKPLQSLIRWLYLEILPAIRDFIKNLNRQRLIRTAILGLGFGLIAGFLISKF